MIGLLKKDTRKIQRKLQKLTASYVRRSTPYKIEVRTPHETLIDDETNSDLPGTSLPTLIDKIWKFS
jgi:hypothetical protein